MMNHIYWDDLEKSKGKLLLFSKLSEKDIQKIFIKKDEIEIIKDEGDEIKYSFSLPLYAKFILRFRQEARRNQACLHEQICSSKSQLLQYFGMAGYSHSYMMGLFAWIKNSFGCYDVVIFEGNSNSRITEDDIDNSKMLVKWRESNGIEFYFSLEQNYQKKLVSKYNKEVVDTYNSYMNNYE